MSRWLDVVAPAIEGTVAAFLDEHGVPGAAVGVVADGELAWATGQGFADLDASTPPDAATGFRIASITKTFTATAVVRLRDEGLLSLDDPLARHLPELKAARNPFGSIEDVTIRGVLLHRSGLVSEPPLVDWRANRHPSIAETLRAADRIEVVVPPGSVDKYSNLGYQLLGEIVERRGGRPFREMIRTTIVEPLGMASTGFEPPPAGAVAVGYDRGGFEGAPRRSAGRDKPTDAEGAMWSTVGDLARWIGLQLTGESPGGEPPLREESLREMQRPLVLTDETWTSAQGLSWYHKRRADRIYVGHAGGTPGFSARVAFSVPHGVGTIVLLNGRGRATDLALDIADAVVAARVAATPARERPRRGAAPDAVRPYLGAYAWPDFEETLRVEWRGGALALVWAGGDGAAPRLESTGEPDTFSIRGGREIGERCVFRRDAAGRVLGVDLAGYPLTRSHPID
jgi:CubicO group peptidase (beta-lactamase class C family)